MTNSDHTWSSKSNAGFPSPNSPLPPKQLEKLQECIEAANNLLRTLGNPRDEENLTQLRLYFQSLRGTFVKVEVDCKGVNPKQSEGCNLLGILMMGGKDFIQLNAMGEQQLIMYPKICSLQYQPNMKETIQHQELIDIDSCLRKELVLHFGEVVACNPTLLNIFLGIPLHLQLLSYVGCPVAIKLEGDETTKRGVLVDSKDDSIRISVGKECQDYNLDELCFITVNSDDHPKKHSIETEPEDPAEVPAEVPDYTE